MASNNNTTKSQIKSKARVADHGEVFTNEREVNAMLDLVRDESFNIESTFLEPACGDGNFLIAILDRKLKKVEELFSKYRPDYEKYSIVALSSIYGVELLQDNTDSCIERLYKHFEEIYKQHMKNDSSEKALEAAHYILRKNILCGDALTLLKNDGTPIVFAEWKWIKDTLVKRRDFELSKIFEAESYSNKYVDNNPDQLNLFFAVGEDAVKDVYDSVNKPIREFPPTDYREITKYE